MQKIRQKTRQLLDFSVGSQIAFVLLSEIIVGLFITIVGVGLFLKLAAEVTNKEMGSFDLAVTNAVYLLRSPFMTPVMNAFTFFGGELFLDVIIFLTIVLLFRKHKKDALIFSFILALGIGLNLYLKDFFHRPRPDFFPLAFEKTYSFPSGHAMNSFVFYTCVSYFIFWHLQHKRIKYILIVSSAVLIFLIGLSRIYLGVHYPTDVLAGFIAGLCLFVVVLLFEKTVIFFRQG